MLLPFEVPQSTWGRGNGTGKIHRLETFKKTAGSTWSMAALKSYRAKGREKQIDGESGEVAEKLYGVQIFRIWQKEQIRGTRLSYYRKEGTCAT